MRGSTIKFEEIELAFDWLSSSEFDNSAYVSKSTGRIYWDSEYGDAPEPIPEEVYESDDYLLIPNKQNLDLGSNLVWKFVRTEIPGLEPKVREIFSRKGAYRRYKDFLDHVDLLDKWYDFENQKTKEALLGWCRDNDLKVEEK